MCHTSICDVTNTFSHTRRLYLSDTSEEEVVGSLMSRRLRVVVVHEQGAGGEGLRTLIRGLPQFLLVAEAPSGPKALELVGTRNPDIAILDMSLPGAAGLELARTIVNDHPHVKILVITVEDDAAYVRDVIAAGVGGCLLKSASIEEIGRALMSIARGESYYSPEVSRMVEEELMKPESSDARRKAS